MNYIKNNIKKFRNIFLENFDVSTAEGRSKERYRRAGLTSITLMSARIVNILTGLISIPITLNYLKIDLFGVWMTLTSFIAFLEFSDFGLGVGLQNSLIKCKGNNDEDTPRILISNALILLSTLSIILIVIAIFILPFVPWSIIIKTDTTKTASEILPTAQAMLIAFSIGLPTSLLQRICDAFQFGYYGYVCLLIGRLLGFTGVILCVLSEKPLWLLASVYIGTPFLIIAAGMLKLWQIFAYLRPWPLKIDFYSMRKIAGIGSLSLIIRISYLILNNGPAIIIANRIDASAVGIYSVVIKMMGVGSLVSMTIMTSLWGAFGEAAVRGELKWIKKTLIKSIKIISIIFIPLYIILIYFGRQIISWWTGNLTMIPSFELLIACATNSLIIGGYCVILNICLSGINRMWTQSIYFPLITAFGLGTAMLIGTNPSIDIIVWSITMTTGIGLLICMVFDLKKVLNGSEN